MSEEQNLNPPVYPPNKKKLLKLKTALFFGYDGSEYLGSQYNKGVKTVESVLL